MDVKVYNEGLFGTVEIPSSKSVSHRAIIAAALADGVSELYPVIESQDMQATISAVEAIGAKVRREGERIVLRGVGGKGEVTAVLDYGDRVTENGLSLLNGPGNDIVAITNLTAAGVHMILFTTGRGTPLGAPVPTVKISTNKVLADRKKGWIDYDSSPVLEGADLDDDFFDFVISVASGKETKNEVNGYKEISIFKDGVVL